jgi:AIPR protein
MKSPASIKPSLQDFSLINTRVQRIKEDNELQELSEAFYLFVGDLICGLQDDEVRDAITDNSYLQKYSHKGGHDRGIDLFHIENDATNARIHLFNCKYVSKFEKSKGNFPSSEIDKIVQFLDALLSQDENLTNEINVILASKVREVWDIFDSQNPSLTIHICVNHYQGFEPQEKLRFERAIEKYSNFSVEYHLMPELVQKVTSQGRKIVNAKLKAIDRNYFEKSDGNVRALVANVDARDLIRIVLNDDAIRQKVDFSDEEFASLRSYEILEDAFEDNVRVHLKKSSINLGIKYTALSDENSKFFYYNNGITLTCNSFSYQQMRSPIISLEDIQIVNGSQTIRSLYGAFLENPSAFRSVELLCRICETQDRALSTRIAEYTNSQNPVKSRDIRSIDFVQIKLEKEFASIGKFYERKRHQYSDKPKKDRLDAEKVGQVMIAFYNSSPFDAKNRKKVIFGDRYEHVFDENVTAEKVLLAYELFEKIEEEKFKVKEELLRNAENRSVSGNAYIIHASYYVLYTLGEMSRRNSINFANANFQKIWSLYPKAIQHLENGVQEAKKRSGRKYSDAVYFRSERPKKYFEDILEANPSMTF